MSEQSTIHIGFINIAAQPHPKGVYRALLDGIARNPVIFWGHEAAAITKPVEEEGGLFEGQIIVWTEIDPDSPGIDKRSFKEVNLEEAGIVIPGRYGLNFRAFNYVFNEQKHIFVYEAKNEERKTLSPQRVRRILGNLVTQFYTSPDLPDFEITPIPHDDSLDRVLGLARLDSVLISVRVPNPDALPDEKIQRVYKRLAGQNAKREDRKLVRAPSTDGLELDEENRIWAEVASFNGYVKASGKDMDGESVEVSTKQYPKILEVILERYESLKLLIREIARRQ